MAKITMTISFEYTHSFDDKEAQQAVDTIVNFKDFAKLPPKQKAFAGLIKEAFEKGGHEAAAKELIRFNTRTTIGELIGFQNEGPIRVKLND